MAKVVQKAGQVRALPYSTLDVDVIELYLKRVLAFLKVVTASHFPWVLLPAAVHARVQTGVCHMLSVSELKGQRLYSGHPVMGLVFEVARNLALSSPGSANEVVAALAQKRAKLQHFGASGTRGESALGTLSEVLSHLDCVIAPRRDKYHLQGNQLAHLAQEHKSVFIEHHRYLVAKYAQDEEVIQPVQAKAETKVEPEVPHAPKAPIETKEHVTATQPKVVHVQALAPIEEQEESSSETPIE